MCNIYISSGNHTWLAGQFPPYSRESGDVEYVCRFDPSGRVRREGSFIYQAGWGSTRICWVNGGIRVHNLLG